MTKTQIRILSILGLAILALIIIAYRLDFFAASPSQAEPKNEDKDNSEKTEATLAKGLILKTSELLNNIRVTGTILPNEEVELTAETAGMITQINFQEGSQVAKGQVLVKINDQELRAQLERLQYQIELYEKREFRQRKLLEKGGASQDEYEAVLAEWNALKAQAKEVEAKIRKTAVRAPFSGTVGLRQVSKGSYVTPGNPIVNLVNLQTLKIEFSVPEKYMSEIARGQEVRVSAKSSDTTYPAKIYAIEPKIDIETRSITAKAIIEQPDRRLMPGAFVNIEIIFERYSETLQVPSVALIPELGGQKVFLYQNGKAKAVKVETGIRSENTVQITKGLKQGDTLIYSGIMNVRPEKPIKLIEIQ